MRINYALEHSIKIYLSFLILNSKYIKYIRLCNFKFTQLKQSYLIFADLGFMNRCVLFFVLSILLLLIEFSVGMFFQTLLHKRLILKRAEINPVIVSQGGNYCQLSPYTPLHCQNLLLI